jgi:hypothetical protein
MLIGNPEKNIAAVALIRAAIIDDKDSGVLILTQNEMLTSASSAMGMSLAAVAARALMSACGYNMAQVMKMLDAWSDEYALEVADGHRDPGA